MKLPHTFQRLALLAPLALFWTSCQNNSREDAAAQNRSIEFLENSIPGQYVVMIDNSVIPSSKSQEPRFSTRAEKSAWSAQRSVEIQASLRAFLKRMDIREEAVFAWYTSAFTGFAANLSEEQARRLLASPEVADIQYDQEVKLDPVEVIEIADPRSAPRADVIPCGVAATGYGDGSTKDEWIWIVDSGIDLTHPDLNVVTNSTYAKTYVGGTPDDCNGHGSHVAGTAAAKSNGSGVIGVSAGAAVVPVRVFNCTGGSATSTILSGINHVAANDLAGDVMNLSLGGYFGSNCANNSTYRSAVLSVANGGTHVAIAAGNSSANAALYQPACISGTRIYTIASMTCSGAWSSFSNFGRPPIDWIAPGSSIYSTYKDGGYATLSGTSMATPHVAGILHQRNAAPVNCGTVVRSGVSYPKACL